MNEPRAGPETIFFSDNVARQKFPVYHTRAICSGLTRVTTVRTATACAHCVFGKRTPAYLNTTDAEIIAASQCASNQANLSVCEEC